MFGLIGRSRRVLTSFCKCLTEQAKPAAFETSSGNRCFCEISRNKSSAEACARADPVLSVDRTDLASGPGCPSIALAAPGEDGLQFVWRRPKTWESSDLRFRPEKRKVGFRQTYFASLATRSATMKSCRQ